MSTHLRRSVNSPRSSRRSNRVSEGEIDSLTPCNFIRQNNNSWSTGQFTIQELCDVQEPNLLVAFLPEADIISTTVRSQLSSRFKIPAGFWTSVAQNASGFFGCQDARADNGELEFFSSHFRFLIKDSVKPDPRLRNSYDMQTSYMWHKLGFYTIWTPQESLLVLCFGLPTSLQQSLSNSTQLHLDDPFSFHAILVENIIAFYDETLWSWRDVIRDLEKNRTSPENPKPDYVTMHEIARHVIHFSETLAMARETLASLIQEHEIFLEENTSHATPLCCRTKRVFRSQRTFFRCLHLRSEALKERLQNEINLAFNTVAQHDSRIAVQIGKATQTDSAAVKTISVLGLAFLPGTFICALFSTSFFSFSPGTSSETQHWTVSEKFWIYWAVAIPVTVVTVVCWVVWQRTYKIWSEKSYQKSLDNREEIGREG